MKRIMTIVIAILCAFTMTLSMSFASAGKPVYEDLNKISGEYWSNVLFYGNSDRAPSNFLAKTNGGFWRIKFDDNGVRATKLTSGFKRESAKTIKKELKYAVGFHESNNYYYLFFSDANVEENNKKEVFRIVKYDSNWNRLGSCSLYGQNAIIIGEYSVRAAEHRGFLFIHSDHTMYKSDDGLNHEANFLAKVRISDMKLMESSGGDFTCSHSFDEYITVDDAGNVIILNKGDYSGAEIIGTFEKTALEDGLFTDCYFGIFSSAIIENPYSHGDGVWGFENYVYLGGLEYSTNNYLTAGSSLALDDNWDNNKVSNVFITVTPRSEVTKEEVYEDLGGGWGSTHRPFTKNDATTLKWITSYKEGSATSAGRPKLVKIGNDRYLLIWAQVKTRKDNWSSYSTTEDNIVVDCEDFVQNGKLSYVILDGNGNKESGIKTISGYLSDCNVVPDGSTAKWFYTPYGGPTVFCSLDIAGGTITKVQSKNILEASVSGIENKTYTGKQLTQNVVVKHSGKTLRNGTDYTISYSNNKNVGKATVTLVGKGDYAGTVKKNFKINPKGTTIKKLKKRDKQSITVYWKKNNKQTTGYQVQYSLSKSFKKKKTVRIKKNAITKKTIVKLKSKKKYFVKIRTYKKIGSVYYYSNWSKVKTVKTR